MSSNSRTANLRHYCWTWFPDEETQDHLKALVKPNGTIDKAPCIDLPGAAIDITSTYKEKGEDKPIHMFSVYQLEKCPVTGRLHFQGYTHFHFSLSFNKFLQMVSLPTIHCEPCKGDFKANMKYCTKEDTRVSGPWYIGNPPRGQGHRTDLDALLECAEQHLTLKECIGMLRENAMKHAFLYQKTVKVLLDIDKVDQDILDARQNVSSQDKHLVANMRKRRDQRDDEDRHTLPGFSPRSSQHIKDGNRDRSKALLPPPSTRATSFSGSDISNRSGSLASRTSSCEGVHRGRRK